LTVFPGNAALKSEAIVHRASACANCAVPVSGNFCPACGQETTLHVPSAREFLHEFIGHYVALEGKLWNTLGRLLFKPGRLTCEYLAGRRVRYVQPLRLYLTLSIIFFALFKFFGQEATSIYRSDKPPVVAHAAGAATGPEVPNHTAAAANNKNNEVSRWLAGISPKLGEKADKFWALSDTEKEHRFKSAFFGYAPYAMFCLMPVFAFYLKLLYLGSGRRYGEHLLFALHSNAFAFLMLILLWVTPALPLLHPALGLWLVFYLPTAMRRVYGGTRLATGGRWLVLLTLHALSIAAAMAGAVVLGLAFAT
jgi:hypothetical protein